MGGKAIPNAQHMKREHFEPRHFDLFIKRMFHMFEGYVKIPSDDVRSDIVGSSTLKNEFNDIDFMFELKNDACFGYTKGLDLARLKVWTNNIACMIPNCVDFSKLFFVSVPYFTPQRTVCQVDLQFVLNKKWSSWAFGTASGKYKMAHRNEWFFQVAQLFLHYDEVQDCTYRYWFHPNLGYLYGHRNGKHDKIALSEADHLRVVSWDPENFLSHIFTCNPSREQAENFEDVWYLIGTGHLNPLIDQQKLIKNYIAAIKKKGLEVPLEYTVV